MCARKSIQYNYHESWLYDTYKHVSFNYILFYSIDQNDRNPILVDGLRVYIVQKNWFSLDKLPLGGVHIIIYTSI